MKILIIGNSSGSILGFRFPLILSLINKGYSVSVVANDFSLEDIKTLERNNIKSFNINLDSSSKNPLKEIKSILEIKKIISNEQPDYVFSYFTKPVIYSSIAARLLKVKNITGMVEGLGITYTIPEEGIKLNNIILKFIQTILFKLCKICCDKLIVLNDDDERFFIEKIGFKNVFNIGGIGVDLHYYKSSDIDINNINFLFIGRLFKEKGICYFLDAAEKLKLIYPSVTFTVLGEIDINNKNSISKEYLEKFISNDIIHYPGRVDDVREYIQKSSMLVLPSYYREGLPRSIQESLACGRPVITTLSPGCKQSIKNFSTGFLVEPYSTDSLYECMEFIISNANLLIEMSTNSRRFSVEKFDINKINEQIIKIISDEK